MQLANWQFAFSPNDENSEIEQNSNWSECFISFALSESTRLSASASGRGSGSGERPGCSCSDSGESKSNIHISWRALIVIVVNVLSATQFRQNGRRIFVWFSNFPLRSFLLPSFVFLAHIKVKCQRQAIRCSCFCCFSRRAKSKSHTHTCTPTCTCILAAQTFPPHTHVCTYINMNVCVFAYMYWAAAPSFVSFSPTFFRTTKTKLETRIESNRTRKIRRRYVLRISPSLLFHPFLLLSFPFSFLPFSHLLKSLIRRLRAGVDMFHNVPTICVEREFETPGRCVDFTTRNSEILQFYF